MRPAAEFREASVVGSGERHTRALVALTRTVWQEDCDFERALAVICETAARTLQVSRVNVWRHDPERSCLQCLHAYELDGDRHAPVEDLEALTLEEDDYVASLEDVRAFDVADVDADPRSVESLRDLRDYLHRHDIHSLLDAPVRSAGRLYGVICHEQQRAPRAWTREDAAFAGSMGDYVAMAMELERRHEAEREVEHLRLHDTTTDLPNQDYLVELLRLRLRAPQHADAVVAVVHVKLGLPYASSMPADGPSVDDAMSQMADCLRQGVGAECSIARVRADAFALLPQRHVCESDVVHLAERCVGIACALPPWRGIDVEVAVGVAFAHAASENDVRVLMRNAEQASERAQARGRHHYEVFDIEHHRGLLQRLQLEQSLRKALAEEAFEVHYQPERDLRTDAWVAAEALVRWRDGGVLRVAADFIDVAEDSRLILLLGRWVLARACHDACAWPGGADAPQLRVNVSALQFDGADLVADVTTVLADSGLPPSRLCLEITETTLMRTGQDVIEVLHRLKALGIALAIDDFGTGYSSLAYLKRLPADALKLDRGFVAGLPDDRYNTAIVRAVAGIAADLGIEIVAEGVETQAQADALQACGVRRAQGFLFAPALPQDLLLHRLGGGH